MPPRAKKSPKNQTPTPEIQTPTPEIQTPTHEIQTPTHEIQTPTPEIQTTPEIQKVASEESVPSSNQESNLISIITPEIKHNADFKKELAYLARSDAHHDLGDLFKESMYKDKTIQESFDSGLPVKSQYSFHEGEAFAAVILSSTVDGTNIAINGSETELQKALNSVPDCTSENIGKFSMFDVGVQNIDTKETTPIFKYKVTKFIIKCSNNAKFKDEDLVSKACKSDFGKKFVENTKLGEDGQEAAIIVDFSQHHFVEDLTKGEKSEFVIHYLMTPEVVNDPAGKPNVNNKSLFDVKDNGIRLKSYVELGNNEISYTKFDENDPIPSNNFFSNYDFTLSPIKQIFTKQKAEKLITTLNIKYENGNGKPLTDVIEDSKGENSITTVLGYLKKILNLIVTKKGDDTSNNFNFNSKCQQKRGGDWFQALACIDARNREISQILPSKEDPIRLSPDCPVYLVTHDRIAVSYALLNGVNVIYLDYYGRIFIFKNAGDKTLKSSGKPMEQILFEGLKEKWDPTNVKTSVKFTELMTTAQKYTTDRNEYLNGDTTRRNPGKNTLFENQCGKILESINSITFADKIPNAIANYQKIVKNSLQQMFTMAVELMFIKINLVEITNDINFVNSNKTLLEEEDYKNTPEFNLLINNFCKSINNIKSIQDKFGSIAASATFANAFNTWVSINVSKLDVYKSANNILVTSGKNEENIPSFDLDRLINFYNKDNTQERKTDIHIFLPFIQNLDGSERENILKVLVSLISKTSDYYTNIKASDSSGRSSRRGGVSPNEVYCNMVANLIYESFIFIKHDEYTNINQEDSVFSESKKIIIEPISTDNILLRTDKFELDILKGNEGKNSNYTGDNIDTSDSQDSQDSQESQDSFHTVEEPPDSLLDKVRTIISKDSVEESPDSLLEQVRGLVCKEDSDKHDSDSQHSFMTVDDEPDYQSGGLSYMYAFNNLTPDGRRAAASVICDVGIKQVTWPLLTTVLLENGDKDSINNFISQIYENIPEISEDPEVYSQDNPIIVSLNEKISSLESQSTPPNVDGTSGGAPPIYSAVMSSETPEVVVKVHNLASKLFNKISAKVEPPPNPNPNPSLMLNFNLGFHPLVPIYVMLTAYYNTLDIKSDNDPFFYTYFTYINVLEKMKNVIESNYLSNINDNYNTSSAYLIGFGLNTMMIKANTSILQNIQILEVINMIRENYYEFSLKNDCFSGLVTGAIHQSPSEEILGMGFLSNKLFTNFINNQVNIKSILGTGISVDNLPDFHVLKNRIFTLMGEIVVKVNADRGTPLNRLGTSGVAQGIQGISRQERAARAALSQERASASPQTSPPTSPRIVRGPDVFSYSQDTGRGNVVQSTLSSPSSPPSSQRTRGGKITRKNKKNKKNVKTKNIQKNIKNKTKKIKKIKKNKNTKTIKK